MLLLQYQGKQSQAFANKVRSIINAQIVFTNRKSKTAVTSLMSSFYRELKSNVVYNLPFCGCFATYFGQTDQNLAAKIGEHKKEDSPVGIYAYVSVGRKRPQHS